MSACAKPLATAKPEAEPESSEDFTEAIRAAESHEERLKRCWPKSRRRFMLADPPGHHLSDAQEDEPDQIKDSGLRPDLRAGQGERRAAASAPASRP